MNEKMRAKRSTQIRQTNTQFSMKPRICVGSQASGKILGRKDRKMDDAVITKDFANTSSDHISATPISTVLPWILAITRPVHTPLLFSICMRIISQLCNVLLFACAGGGLIAAWRGVPVPIFGVLTAPKLAALLMLSHYSRH